MSKVRRLFNKHMSRYQKIPKISEAILGRADGVVEVPGVPYAVYVRESHNSIPYVVYNFRVAIRKNLPVNVGEDPLMPGFIQVLNLNWKPGTNLGDVQSVPPHADSHLLGGDDPVFISDRQIVPLLCYVKTGMIVHVNGGYVVYRGQTVRVDSEDIDLTSYIPVAGAVYVLIRVDDAGAVTIQEGTPVDSLADLTESDVPVCEIEYAPLGYVALYEGQTALGTTSSDPGVRMLLWGNGKYRTLPEPHHTTHEEGGDDEIKLDDLATPDDNTDLDATDSVHGLLPKLSGDDTQFLDGTGNWTTPAGGSGDGRWVPGVFLASFFDEDDESLHILKSPDGLDWTDVGAGYGDTVRDPTLLYRNNKWWIAHTHDGSPTDVIPIINSDDLLTWTSVVELDTSAMSNPGPHAWAPEWFIDDDGSVHLIITGGDTGSHALYETHPTNAGWTTWSDFVEITGTGFPDDMIDAFIVKLDLTYYLFYKDDDTDYICLATSTSLTSGYTEIEDGDWTGFGSGVEGQCLVQIDSATWRIYYNETLTNGQYYSESVDNFVTWSSPAAISDLSYLSHGTVLQVSDFPAYNSIMEILGYGGIGGGGGSTTGNLVPILILDETAPSGGQADFNISSGLDDDYAWLEIWIAGKTEKNSATYQNIRMYLGTSASLDTTDGNYRSVYHYAGSAGHDKGEGDDALIGLFATSQNSDMSGQCRIWITNPGGSLHKVASSVSVFRHSSTSEEVTLRGYQWENTGAIDRLHIDLPDGSDFAEGTRCIVVGYKNTTLSDADAFHQGNLGEILYTAEKTDLVDDDMVLIEDSENAYYKAHFTLAALKTYLDQYILVRDEKSSGTNGGDFTSGDWRKRDINTEVSDDGGYASIASSQITLAAGTYRAEIWCPCHGCGRHQARLRNVTDGSTTLLGTSGYCNPTNVQDGYSVIRGRFTIAASKTFEVQHKCESTMATYGFGVAGSFDTEVYTVVEFQRM